MVSEESGPDVDVTIDATEFPCRGARSNAKRRAQTLASTSFPIAKKTPRLPTRASVQNGSVLVSLGYTRQVRTRALLLPATVLALVLVGASSGAQSIPPVPAPTGAIVDFERVTPPPHFANYFGGEITYDVTVRAIAPLNTTLRIDYPDYQGQFTEVGSTSLPVVAAAGQTVKVRFVKMPSRLCAPSRFRLTLVGTNSFSRIGRMTPTCTFKTTVTDGWANLSAAEKAQRSTNKLNVSAAQATPEPVCNTLVKFQVRVENNSDTAISRVSFRWRKGTGPDTNTQIPAHTSKAVSWEEPPGDYFDDPTINSTTDLRYARIDPNVTPADHPWQMKISPNCTVAAGLE